MHHPSDGAHQHQCAGGAADQPAATRRRRTLMLRCSGGLAPLVFEFFDGGFSKQFCPGRRHRFMDEAIHQTCADQTGQRRLIVTVTGGHDHEIRKLTLDLRDEHARRLMQCLRIEHDDADLACDQ